MRKLRFTEVGQIAQGHDHERQILHLNPGLFIPGALAAVQMSVSLPLSDKGSCLFRVSQGSAPALPEETPSSLECR